MPADVGLMLHVYPLDLSYYPSVNRRGCLEFLVWTFRTTALSNNALFAIGTKRKISTKSIFKTYFELTVFMSLCPKNDSTNVILHVIVTIV